MTLIKSLFAILIATSALSCSITPMENIKVQQESYSDVQSVTLKPGDMAPNFSIMNGDDELISLTALLKEKHVMLLFYRGEWCPFCISQLESFEAVLPQLTQHNVQLVAVSPDTVITSQNTQRNFGLDYLFLSDTTHEVVNDYGVSKNAESGQPHPAIFLINQQGKIVWFYVSENYKERPTGQQMLEVVNTRLK